MERETAAGRKQEPAAARAEGRDVELVGRLATHFFTAIWPSLGSKEIEELVAAFLSILGPTEIKELAKLYPVVLLWRILSWAAIQNRAALYRYSAAGPTAACRKPESGQA